LFVTESNNVISAENKRMTVEQLNSLFSDKRLGAFIEDNKTTFRLFVPNADYVELVIFKKVDSEEGISHKMQKDDNAIWEVTLEDNLNGFFYAYKVYHSENESNVNLAVDPYAKAVATFTDYLNPRKSIVFQDNYNWEDDEWIQRDWHDLVIYEMHVRDMTAHKSSETKSHGTYKGLIEPNTHSGINYIKELGVNTIEILPSQEYGYMEIPYKDSLNGQNNTWNPYERNHWGYMTSNFFAPAAYYAEDIGKLEKRKWIGVNGKQVVQFKNMVKAFHKQGIAVVMDVVFNHLSEYELGNLKQIDKDYYFRLNSNGDYISESFCGNDLKTERPMVRRLIIDSILYWMKEYHIDGFRFDLGKLIDWETIEAVIHEARKLNPHVIFVCEPWGGGYDPKGFSLRDWASWNDQIRNGVKGENPFNGLGWIFGRWNGNNNLGRIKSYIRGTLEKEPFGLFQKAEHSVNYLESHDGYTLGDFIRLGIGKIKNDEIIVDVNENIKLTESELKLHKLAALFLFISKGITMIHAGQEFARSKVIAFEENIHDEHFGMLDHNSYNKDNETNYINYLHVQKNKELFNYYKGLIKLRKKHEAFRRADFENYIFKEKKSNEFSIEYLLKYRNNTYFIALNANPQKTTTYNLPDGWWKILVDKNIVMNRKNKSLKGKITLEPTTGIVLQLRK
jgi:pullulanase/glycogen debranching enzyme